MFGNVIDHHIFDFQDTVCLFDRDVHIEALKFGGQWFLVSELQLLIGTTNTEVRVTRRQFPYHFKNHIAVGLICTDYIARHFATMRGIGPAFIHEMRIEMASLRSQYDDAEQEQLI